MLDNKHIAAWLMLGLFFCFNTAFAERSCPQWDSLLNVTIGAVNNEKIYQRFAKGKCTWYAWGRFHEVHKKKIKFKQKLGLDAKLWPELVVNCKVDAKLAEKSIAISESGLYGHLIFIEHIDSSTVYYTEANADGNGLYDRGVDCVLKRAELDGEFMKQFGWFVHR